MVEVFLPEDKPLAESLSSSSKIKILYPYVIIARLSVFLIISFLSKFYYNEIRKHNFKTNIHIYVYVLLLLSLLFSHLIPIIYK